MLLQILLVVSDELVSLLHYYFVHLVYVIVWYQVVDNLFSCSLR